MGYHHIDFQIPTGRTANVRFTGQFYGLLSYITTSSTGYGLYNINGYGVGVTRTRFTLIDKGDNTEMSISVREDASGFVLTNSGSLTYSISIILWIGNCIIE